MSYLHWEEGNIKRKGEKRESDLVWLCRGIFLCKGIIPPAEGAPAKILALLVWPWWSLWTSAKNKGKRWNSHIQEEGKVKWWSSRQSKDLEVMWSQMRVLTHPCPQEPRPSVFSKAEAGRISAGCCHSWQVLLAADWWDWHTSKKQEPNSCFPLALERPKWHKSRVAFFRVRNSLKHLCWL